MLELLESRLAPGDTVLAGLLARPFLAEESGSFTAGLPAAVGGAGQTWAEGMPQAADPTAPLAQSSMALAGESTAPSRAEPGASGPSLQPLLPAADPWNGFGDFADPARPSAARVSDL